MSLNPELKLKLTSMCTKPYKTLGSLLKISKYIELCSICWPSSVWHVSMKCVHDQKLTPQVKNQSFNVETPTDHIPYGRNFFLTEY